MKFRIISLAGTLALMAAAPAFAQETPVQEQDRERVQDQDREQVQEHVQEQDRSREVYGWQLMNDEERANYRSRMQSAKTEEEREQIRAEHHEQMQARAKEQGVTLPDTPPSERGPRQGRQNDRGKSQDKQRGREQGKKRGAGKGG